MVSFFLLAKLSFQASKTHTLDKVLYSTSTPCQPDVMGMDNQVYNIDDPVEYAIEIIRAGNVTAVSSTDASVHFLHIHAPRVYDILQGDHEWIVGNASGI
jgi:hypothetical protein